MNPENVILYYKIVDGVEYAYTYWNTIKLEIPKNDTETELKNLLAEKIDDSHTQELYTAIQNPPTKTSLMSDNFENAIFDFGQLEGTEGYVLDDELTIAILKGDTGDKIGRLTLEEQPHYDSIVYYPGFNKIQKSLNNYMFMKGI